MSNRNARESTDSANTASVRYELTGQQTGSVPQPIELHSGQALAILQSPKQITEYMLYHESLITQERLFKECDNGYTLYLCLHIVRRKDNLDLNSLQPQCWKKRHD